MQQIKIETLTPHQRNNEFFDDMEGEKWEEFLESVRTSGVIEPIVVTTDMVIVSGYQYVRAYKELGIDSIVCDIRHYTSEDQIIKDLLEINMRQIGIKKMRPSKVGRCLNELLRIYQVIKPKHVYVINDKNKNRVKIGYTNNIKRRMKELNIQTDQYFISPLCLNYQSIIHRLNIHLREKKRYQYDGEWFLCDWNEAINYLKKCNYEEKTC